MLDEFRHIFEGKVVLITGGTGFLGRNLIKEILKFNPQSIRVFSRDEVKHYKLKEALNDPRIRYLVGDVRDFQRLNKAMAGCDIVIHAAALKRIDMIEYNVQECIQTNITGTMNVIHACIENNVERAVYISSDKACSPVNTYGASKFVGERAFIESNFNKGSCRTIFNCVRYGNVLDSTGSLIPMVKDRIERKEELFLTDSEMTRFFITPIQAVKLIFNALKYGVGGEIFIPKLDSFKIIDVLNLMKEKLNYDKGIKIVGTRPGEKIHELMINDAEAGRTYEFDEFFIIASQIEEYQDEAKTDYMTPQRKVKFKDYSSESVVAPISLLADRLIQLNIIK